MITANTGYAAKVSKAIHDHRNCKPFTFFNVGCRKFIVYKPHVIYEVSGMQLLEMLYWSRFCKDA